MSVEPEPNPAPNVIEGPREPTRTCVGCRNRDGKTALVRIVVCDGEYLPDPQARMPGRGAYLHPVPECLHLAVRRGALRRALRAPGETSDGRLRDHWTTWYLSSTTRELRDERSMNGKQ